MYSIHSCEDQRLLLMGLKNLRLRWKYVASKFRDIAQLAVVILAAHVIIRLYGATNIRSIAQFDTKYKGQDDKNCHFQSMHSAPRVGIN